jgi:Protein of unknown function (DUF3025)
MALPEPQCLAVDLRRIDWSPPWWNPWRVVGQRVAAHVAHGLPLHAALNLEAASTALLASGTLAAAQPSMQFVAQAALPEGQAYEAFIFSTGQVPTRENLHDFFNGLAWLVFPHTKRRLNQMQAGEIHTSGVQTTRGPLRDALTLFDENAALWPVAHGEDSPVLDALRAKDWQRACITLRAHWPAHAPVLFGHALLEKLVSPYKSITAHVFIAQTAIKIIAGDATCSALDSAVAQQLQPAALVPKPFIPLPVLGVPQWWPANAQADFYQDTQVFRAPR